MAETTVVTTAATMEEEATSKRTLRLPLLSTRVRCSLASPSMVSRFPLLVSTLMSTQSGRGWV